MLKSQVLVFHQQFQVDYVVPEHFPVGELQDMLVVPNKLPHTREDHRPHAYVVMDPYKVFYEVHRMEKQLYLYYKDLGVLACCMRQNDQPKLMNTRQLYQGQVWQNCSLNSFY